MIIKKLVEILEANPESPLYVMLPSGFYIPDHFHVTEVGKIQKTFVDCGGVVRETISCMLQMWTANDFDHRLAAGKLAKILRLGDKILGSEELPVEIEYGDSVASQYLLVDIIVKSKGLFLILSGKQTNCLAPDKCGITGCC